MSQPYDRIFNFSAGPCTLPVEVLEEARDGMLNWNGSGMGVMEMSHRGKVFEGIFQQTKAWLRELAGVPDNYQILFLHGGATLQNTMVPMNLRGEGQTADYVVTGAWGKKSHEAAALLGPTNKAFDAKAEGYRSVPDLEAIPISPSSAYLHFTSNETIQGVEFFTDPVVSVPLVCDMSSDILSRPFDVSRYGLIYAGAQKNMGPAGVTLVIVREDLLQRTPANMQPMLDLKLMAENDSMYNTPPCWSIYMCGLVYKWMLKEGGLTVFRDRNREKASVIYRAIDESEGFFKGHADPSARSVMNVTFTLPSEELTEAFLKGAKAHQLDGLKGHRSVGGCRASIYNAFPLEGCEVLAGYMRDFAAKNG
jgi:phosphoserine aminotransferase